GPNLMPDFGGWAGTSDVNDSGMQSTATKRSRMDGVAGRAVHSLLPERVEVLVLGSLLDDLPRLARLATRLAIFSDVAELPLRPRDRLAVRSRVQRRVHHARGEECPLHRVRHLARAEEVLDGMR